MNNSQDGEEGVESGETNLIAQSSISIPLGAWTGCNINVQSSESAEYTFRLNVMKIQSVEAVRTMAAPKTASIRKRLGSSPWFLSSDVELPFTALKSVTPGTYQWSDQAERKRLPEALLASSLLSWYLHQPGSQQLKRCVRVVKVQ